MNLISTGYNGIAAKIQEQMQQQSMNGATIPPTSQTMIKWLGELDYNISKIILRSGFVRIHLIDCLK